MSATEIQNLYDKRKEITAQINLIKKEYSKDISSYDEDIRKKYEEYKKQYDEYDSSFVEKVSQDRGTLVYKTKAYNPLIEMDLNKNNNNNDYNLKNASIKKYTEFKHSIIKKYKFANLVSDDSINENINIDQEDKNTLNQLKLNITRDPCKNNYHNANKCAIEIFDNICKINNDFYSDAVKLTKKEYEEIYLFFSENNEYYKLLDQCKNSLYDICNKYQEKSEKESKSSVDKSIKEIINEDFIEKMKSLKEKYILNNDKKNNIKKIEDIIEIDINKKFEKDVLEKSIIIDYIKKDIIRKITDIATAIANEIRKTKEYKNNKANINKIYSEKIKDLKTKYKEDHNAFGENLEYIMDKRIKTAVEKRDKIIKLIKFGGNDFTITNRNKSGSVNSPIFNKIIEHKEQLKMRFLKDDEKNNKFPNLYCKNDNVKLLELKLNNPNYKKDNKKDVYLYFPVVIENIEERYGDDIWLMSYCVKKNIVANNHNWTVIFTLKPKKSIIKQKYINSKGTIAVRLGYSETDNGDIEILNALDNEGNEISKTIPQKMIEKYNVNEIIQSERDRYFKTIDGRNENKWPRAFKKYLDILNEKDISIRDYLKSFKNNNAPTWFKDEINRIHYWRHQGIAYKFYEQWKNNRFVDDDEYFNRFETWINFDKKMYFWQRRSFIRFNNYRENLYRNIVSDIRKKYKNVIINKIDLKESQKPKKHNDKKSEKGDNKKRKQQKIANLSFLKTCFKEKMENVTEQTEQKVVLQYKCKNCSKEIEKIEDNVCKCGYENNQKELRHDAINNYLKIMLSN